jgi:hypothetical protein
MAGGAVRESVTIAGYPERVAVARAFAAAVLGRQHPAVETAVLLLSEPVANSVRHSASGLPGRAVTVALLSSGDVTRVQVTDRSGATVPTLRPGVSGTASGVDVAMAVRLRARARGIQAVSAPDTPSASRPGRWSQRRPQVGSGRHGRPRRYSSAIAVADTATQDTDAPGAAARTLRRRKPVRHPGRPADIAPGADEALCTAAATAARAETACRPETSQARSLQQIGHAGRCAGTAAAAPCRPRRPSRGRWSGHLPASCTARHG